MSDTICIEGVLRDDKDHQPSERREQQQQQQQRSPGKSRTSDEGHDQPPARKTKRQKNVETLTRNLSNVSLSRRVDAYIRRNISKPKMAKRDPNYGESRSSSRLSEESFPGESFTEVIKDNDALYV